MILVLIFTLMVAGTTNATLYGVDLSSLASTASFNCLKSQHQGTYMCGFVSTWVACMWPHLNHRKVSFVVMRCWMEVGAVDPNCRQVWEGRIPLFFLWCAQERVYQTLANAAAAGLQVDTYFFPSPHVLISVFFIIILLLVLTYHPQYTSANASADRFVAETKGYPTYGRVWLDIEQNNGFPWSTSCATNVNYISDLYRR